MQVEGTVAELLLIGEDKDDADEDTMAANDS